MYVFDFVLFYTTFGLNINQCHYNCLFTYRWVGVFLLSSYRYSHQLSFFKRLMSLLKELIINMCVSQMLKGRGRDPRASMPTTPQFARQTPTTPQFVRQTPTTPQFPRQTPTTPTLARQTVPPQRAPLARPEPDYEVVEFPTDQYVNAKLQPPPTPPRPPTGKKRYQFS